jgi:hypothetical protein
MKAIAKKILRPDSKGRVCLGSLTEGVSGYKAIVNEQTKEITLKPYTEVPFTEKWIFENKEALSSIKRGLKQSFDKKTTYKGSFADFIEPQEKAK